MIGQNVVALQAPDVGTPVRAVLVKDGVVVEGPFIAGGAQLALYGEGLRIITDDNPAAVGWREVDGVFVGP